MHDIGECRTFSLDDAKDILRDILRTEIAISHPCVTEFILDSNSCDSGVRYIPTSDALARERSHPNMRCAIGIKEIYDDRDISGMIRDIDLVWSVKHIFHESYHLNLMRGTYQKEGLSGRDLDSARIDALSCVFAGYKARMYCYAPSEIDADICGFECAAKWFDGNLPVIDARACLFAKVRELPSWRGDKNARDYNGLVRSLELMRNDYVYILRDNVFNEDDSELVNTIAARCSGWMPEIDKIIDGEIKDYAEIDRLLFSVALDVNSSWIDHHAGLDEEVKSVRKQYPSKLKTGEKIVSSISRVLNMRDSDDLFDDDQKSDQDDGLDF